MTEEQRILDLIRRCMEIACPTCKVKSDELLDPPLTQQQLNACVITVERLFKALDEVAEKMHRPKTLARPDVSRFCDELKVVLIRTIREER